ncbi:MAG: hypothetical protein EOM40_10875 [Clostridia bacterium]|nr:hypothetical protein [Clostridia bacterium]
MWICLDEPESDHAALYKDGAPQRGEIKEETSETQEKDKIEPKTENQKNIMVIVVGLVAAVVIMTGVLLILLRRSIK